MAAEGVGAAAARALRPRCSSMMMREQRDMKEKASPCTFWKSSRYIDSCTCNAQPVSQTAGYAHTLRTQRGGASKTR